MLATHHLPASEFDLLASGSGQYGGTLLAGQVSKRLLQLVAMLREVAAREYPGEAAARFEEWYRQLAELRRAAPAAVWGILGYPMVGAWCTHTLRRLVGQPAYGPGLFDDLGHLGSIVVAAAVRAGRELRTTLRVRSDGSIAVPTYGLARPDAAPGWYPARVAPGLGVDVALPGGVHRIPALEAESDPQWWPLRRLITSGSAPLLDDIDPYRDCHRLGVTGRLTTAETAAWQRVMRAGWQSLERSDAPLSTALADGVAVVVPLVEVDGVGERSASTSDACGAVLLARPAHGAGAVEALAHEHQHTKLSALLDLVPLQRDRHVERVFYAPWRTDARHLSGLLQGAYAYLGLVNHWQVIRVNDDEAGRVAEFEFARWRSALRRTLWLLARAGQFTAAGERFLDGMRRKLAEWRRPAVSQETAFLAREALLDHWLRWRLHNLVPEREAVIECAIAWQAGLAVPPAAPAGSVTVAGPAWSGTNDRLALAYGRLRGHDSWAASPADQAYARADYRSAAEHFEHTIARTPDEADPWAGLALTHRRLRTPGRIALLSRPELIKAVYAELSTTAAAPPIVRLASWVGGG